MLTYDEIEAVADAVERRNTLRFSEGGTGSGREQARPGDVVAAIAPSATGLAIQQLTWGFRAPDGKRLVFNTRIESALAGSRMWADALRTGRCIVPAATFFEHRHEFSTPDGEPVLLASIQQQGRLSVVTTEPNDAVSLIHHRMPLALRFEEVPLWLGEEFATLSDRSGYELVAQPEKRRRPHDPSPDPSQLSLF